MLRLLERVRRQARTTQAEARTFSFSFPAASPLPVSPAAASAAGSAAAGAAPAAAMDPAAFAAFSEAAAASS